MSRDAFIRLGRAVIETEADALRALLPRIDETFANACELILSRKGRVVVMGMGKSGHIARKLAATLASVGSPAFFVHPGEASHGDLGMITPEDTVLALSNSGETSEILTILPLIKRLGVALITLTGEPASHIALAADINLDVSVAQEACPLGLAPTASTTAALAMGDALAIALLEAKGFGTDDFARSHPGGRLGRRLLVRASDIMHTGSRLPAVRSDVTLSRALIEMTEKSLGMTAITDAQDKLVGIFTDGDLRRALDLEGNPNQAPIKAVMTTDCITVHPEILAAECLNIMEQHKISGLLIVDTDNRLIGALNMHDLLRAGVL
ncbi:MAG: arabinose-5-phosphate isomerase [Gammaproteobacteria bacterium]|jgi:arabinose-5-phosphate isomerase